tara:strand:+ start:4076 stop:4330 length:255 start_codon:yes stop_codon:yes gene_type:complete
MSEEDEKPELELKHERQIKAAIKKLNDTMIEVRKYIPDAMYYLEDGSNFNILSGPSHTVGGGEQPLHENVILVLDLRHAECGGW